MGRRKQTDFDLIVNLTAGLTIIAVFSPPVRQMLTGLTVIAILSMAVFLIGLVVFRRVLRDRNLPPDYRVYDMQTLEELQPSKPPPSTQNKDTASLLTKQLHAIDWFQFEKLIAIVYGKLGYTVKRRGGANPDGGIDLVIVKDGVQTGVQCKHWKTRDVGVRAVREFLGALTDAKLKDGIFVTLAGYTGDAKQLAERHGIEILNETGLTALLNAAETNLDSDLFDFLNDTTKYCPKCEQVMILRTAVRGPNPGSKFWGCSNYPHCQYTLPFS